MPPKRSVASPARPAPTAAERPVEQPPEHATQAPPDAERPEHQDEQPSVWPTVDETQTVSTRRLLPVPSTACAICLSAAADFLCSPCGHQCGCETCLRQVEQSGGSKCPICRVRFTSIQRVYVAGSSAVTRNTSRNHTASQQTRQLSNMVDGSENLLVSGHHDEWASSDPGNQRDVMLRQPLLDSMTADADVKRNKACCCVGSVVLSWVAALALIYGTDQPCSIARGWVGRAASPVFGCNETWSGSCKNHTYINYIDDTLFFGCPPVHCNPKSSKPELCPGPAIIPCPTSGICPGASDPGSACPAWKRCQPGGCTGRSCGCPRRCPSHRSSEWCVKAGYGKWISTVSNCTEPSLPVCEGDGGRFGTGGALGWGSGAHAPPVPVDMRKPDELGLSVAEGGRCDRSGRCMCAAGFMPSPEVIATLLLVLSIVTAVSACRCACYLGCCGAQHY